VTATQKKENKNITCNFETKEEVTCSYSKQRVKPLYNSKDMVTIKVKEK